MKFSIVTVSDSSSTGKRKDESGPTLHNLIVNSQRLRNPCVSKTRVIPDDPTVISQTLLELCESADVIITTGGTGLSARDTTPEATMAVVDRRCSGLEVALHTHSLRSTPLAALSRAVAGIRGKTLIVNFPGSVKAVQEYWEVLEPILNHAVDVLNNTDDGTIHSSLARERCL